MRAAPFPNAPFTARAREKSDPRVQDERYRCEVASQETPGPIVQWIRPKRTSDANEGARHDQIDQDPDSSRGRRDHSRRGRGNPAAGGSPRRAYSGRHHRRSGRRRHHRRGRQRPLLRLRPRLLLRSPAGLLRRWTLLLDPPAGLGRLGLAPPARTGLLLGGLWKQRTNKEKPGIFADSGLFRMGVEPGRSNLRHIEPASFTGAGTGTTLVFWRPAPAGRDPGGKSL